MSSLGFAIRPIGDQDSTWSTNDNLDALRFYQRRDLELELRLDTP